MVCSFVMRYPLDVLGVDKFTDAGVIVKARIKTVPIRQWDVDREMNRRIKKKFDVFGIQIPTRTRAGISAKRIRSSPAVWRQWSAAN